MVAGLNVTSSLNEPLVPPPLPMPSTQMKYWPAESLGEVSWAVVVPTLAPLHFRLPVVEQTADCT